MIVELAQVVVVLLVVHSWEDAAAGQLWQILDGDNIKQGFRDNFESNKVIGQ